MYFIAQLSCGRLSRPVYSHMLVEPLNLSRIRDKPKCIPVRYPAVTDGLTRQLTRHRYAKRVIPEGRELRTEVQPLNKVHPFHFLAFLQATNAASLMSWTASNSFPRELQELVR